LLYLALKPVITIHILSRYCYWFASGHLDIDLAPPMSRYI